MSSDTMDCEGCHLDSCYSTFVRYDMSYSDNLCLDCTHACLAGSLEDYESTSLAYAQACSRYTDDYLDSRMCPYYLPTPKPLSQGELKQLLIVWMRKKELARSIRGARCRLANVQLKEDMKRALEQQNHIAEENGEEEIDKAFRGEVVGVEEAGDLRKELEVEGSGNAHVSANACEAENEPHRKEGRRVTFALGVFDQDCIRRNGESRILMRSNPKCYRPGVYSCKEYLDTSGYLEYPENFYQGKAPAKRGGYWPERTHTWTADPSTFVTPMVTLTNEFGDSQTLIRATLPEQKRFPFLVVQDSKTKLLRVVTSPLVQNHVDRHILMRKPSSIQEMRQYATVFRDDVGLERLLFWKDGELWIETIRTMKLRRAVCKREVIYLEPWRKSIEFARKWEAHNAVSRQRTPA